jgi:hypothetical protein
MTARRFLLAGMLAAAVALASAPLQAQTASMSVAPLPTAASPSPTAPAPADPPARVGRLAQMTGTVSFHTSDESQWEAATLNYPITSGNSLWTEPQAHAAIDIGSSRVYLDSQTELDVGTLNDQGFQASLPRGAVFLRVGSNDGGFEVDTPRGAVTVSQPGNYEVVAGDADHPTTVTALNGSAQVAGPGVNMSVAAGQSVQLTGQNPVTGATGPAQQDTFTSYVAGIEQPYVNPAPVQQLAQRQTTQYVSPGMTGYQDLGQYGQWQQTPEYGPIWTPTVAVDWAPYRYGHWAYILPWGWTWVDDAPWGFAPFHYGRWIEIGNRWSWCPGVIVAQPVYAPALVSFFGDVGGIGFNIGIGPSVGWIPLGPGEVWYPPFRYSPRYIRNVNITNVNITNVNITNINIINNRPVGNFMNRRGATLVTANAMADSLPIGRGFHTVPAGAWQGNFAKLAARNEVPVKPTLRTAGLTPASARELGQVLPANGQFPGRAATPGPQVTANQGGLALANGRRLPAFAPAFAGTQTQNAKAALPANALQLKPQQPAAGQQGGGRVITLSNTGGNTGNNAGGQTNGQSWAGQRLGSFNPQGQTQLKAAAPGPAIQPRTNTTNRGFAALGKAGADQNAGTRWSFLPPLQKSGQGGGQAGFQGNGFASSWQSKAQSAPKAQIQGQGQSRVTIVPGGQGSNGQNAVGFGNGNQSWASLPAQTQNRQLQSSRSGQTNRNGQTTWKNQIGSGQKGVTGSGNFTAQQRQLFQAQQQRQANLSRGASLQGTAYSFQQHQPQQQGQRSATGGNRLLLNQKQPGGNN